MTSLAQGPEAKQMNDPRLDPTFLLTPYSLMDRLQHIIEWLRAWLDWLRGRSGD